MHELLSILFPMAHSVSCRFAIRSIQIWEFGTVQISPNIILVPESSQKGSGKSVCAHVFWKEFNPLQLIVNSACHSSMA